jgi:hypothetical protein
MGNGRVCGSGTILITILFLVNAVSPPTFVCFWLCGGQQCGKSWAKSLNDIFVFAQLDIGSSRQTSANLGWLWV